jgi:hypothetical protein
MTWVRLDDAIWRNRKIRKAWKEPRAVGLYILAIAVANDEANDGWVDPDWVEMMIPNKAERNRVVDLLVSLGMWSEFGDGWQIHDYLDYQPSSAKVEEIREARRLAGALGGKARANGRQRG